MTVSEPSTILRHVMMSVATLTVASSIWLAAFDFSAALELWKAAGWELIAWNSLMLAPATAKSIVEKIAGRFNANKQVTVTTEELISNA